MIVPCARRVHLAKLHRVNGTEMTKCALILGSGSLGPIAAHAVLASKYNTQILTLPGNALDPALPQTPFDLNNIADALNSLTAFQPDLVCMIGGVTFTQNHRQQLATYFAEIFGQDKLSHFPSEIGDQVASVMMVKIIENLGARTLGIHELLPDLLCPLGQLGDIVCPPPLQTQISSAISHCLRHAKRDKGQAIILRDGQVCEKETMSGTADMLARYAKSSPPAAPKSILIKCARPGQPLAIDMPTIGPDTITQAKHCNIGLIILEAHRSLLIERHELISRANSANIALLGVSTESANV